MLKERGGKLRDYSSSQFLQQSKLMTLSYRDWNTFPCQLWKFSHKSVVTHAMPWPLVKVDPLSSPSQTHTLTLLCSSLSSACIQMGLFSSAEPETKNNNQTHAGLKRYWQTVRQSPRQQGARPGLSQTGLSQLKGHCCFQKRISTKMMTAAWKH